MNILTYFIKYNNDEKEYPFIICYPSGTPWVLIDCGDDNFNWPRAEKFLRENFPQLREIKTIRKVNGKYFISGENYIKEKDSEIKYKIEWDN
jgi:hypothetical protein